MKKVTVYFNAEHSVFGNARTFNDASIVFEQGNDLIIEKIDGTNITIKLEYVMMYDVKKVSDHVNS